MLWEELNAVQFEEAVEKSRGVCVINIGAIEKHGTHLPVGTDMYIGRKLVEEAARIEPVVVFPYYSFGKVVEARPFPGAIALGPDTIFALLGAVCDEIRRNGFKKIVIFNSHGGNPAFTKFFAHGTLAQKKDYAVYIVETPFTPDEKVEIDALMGSDEPDSHGGNHETSMIMAIRPELVNMNQIEEAGLITYDRLDFLGEHNAYTAISWYAAHPTQQSGRPFDANKRAGQRELEIRAARLAEAFKVIKDDDLTLKLQDEYFALSLNRL